jgi:hypothetical protein
MNRRDLLKALPVAAGAVVAASTSEPQKTEATKVVLEMDGRELAEMIVPHLPSVIARHSV